jgi:hypothetical protein
VEMDVEWKVVKLPVSVAERRLGGIMVNLNDDEQATIPFFEIRLTENKELETAEEKFADFRDRFAEELDRFKRSTYDCACERLGRPPKVAIVFISRDFTIHTDPGLGKNNVTFADAEVGIACFDEEVDMEQFKLL